jgi:hypothetical protein
VKRTCFLAVFLFGSVQEEVLLHLESILVAWVLGGCTPAILHDVRALFEGQTFDQEHSLPFSSGLADK